jgi:predicted AAA+ superfamily ATPase
LIQIKRKNKDNGTVALLIEGARRVGKSYIVEEFAKNNLSHLTFFTTRIMKRKKV